ncbi:unnamed protein product [Polarella glacialis]|uniref:Ion transport domain-containing protein n=3 Tax=Polarella glacialis TaxID=89957 RepID=A0A813E453_POLGL|nr:unnamed protein product [Polarella glacialis]
MNIVDCCAVVPFFAVLALRATDVGAVLGVVRTIRLVRLFRIFKLGRHSASLQLMMVAMSNSVQALGVLVFFLSIGCVLFSSLIFHVEKLSCPDRDELASTIISGNYTQLDLYWSECHADRKTQFGLCCNEDDAPLDFPSISAAFWWSIVTMTTVGFGDVYPRTAQGKIIGAMTMLAGILLLALPIALIGAKFQDAYDNFAGKAKGEMERERVAKAQLRPSLMNMSRRMRKLKFQDQKMSQIANDLGKDLEEADTMRKELATFEDQEAEMQCAILDSMEVVLKQCAHLADKAQATKEKRLREEAAVQGSLGRLSRGSSGLGRGSSRSLISCSRSLSSLAAGESVGADVNLQGTLSGGAAPSTAINVPPSVPGAVVSTNIVEEEDRAAGLRRDSYRISQIFIG